MEEAKRTFEEQMRGQLSGAEVSPPPHVWVAVDGQLANGEIAQYKKSVRIYQWVAAACFLLMSASGAYYWNSNGESSKLTLNEETTSPEKVIVSPVAELAQTNASTTKSDFKQESTSKVSIHDTPSTGAPISNEDQTKTRNVFFATGASDNEKETEFEMLTQQKQQSKENQLARVNSRQTGFQTTMKNKKLDETFGVPVPTATMDLDESYASLWAGVSVGAGSFDPGYTSNGREFSSPLSADIPEDFNTANIAAVREDAFSPANSDITYPVGDAISGGVNIGSQLGKRLVVSSGVHYSAYSTGSTSSLALVDNQTDLALSEADVEEYRALGSFVGEDHSNIRVDEISLNNEFQYITVPLSAGVILLDKKFNITLNTGISSNFLINANIHSESLSVDQDNSQNFESVYFNFLSSVEFGYNIMEKYQLSIAPNYNQAISNFTNSNSLNQSRPRNFGVAVGVKYNF